MWSSETCLTHVKIIIFVPITIIQSKQTMYSETFQPPSMEYQSTDGINTEYELKLQGYKLIQLEIIFMTKAPEVFNGWYI